MSEWVYQETIDEFGYRIEVYSKDNLERYVYYDNQNYQFHSEISYTKEHAIKLLEDNGFKTYDGGLGNIGIITDKGSTVLFGCGKNYIDRLIAEGKNKQNNDRFLARQEVKPTFNFKSFKDWISLGIILLIPLTLYVIFS